MKLGKNTCIYSEPHQFEPLMSSELRGLLRNMKPYCTNRIEAQHIRPREINQALRQDFSSDAVLATKQRLAGGAADVWKMRALCQPL